MKTTCIILLFISFSNALLAQCPSAGRDSSTTYCKNEPFDIATLRSLDADLNGVFIDPMGDTMTSTSQTLVFPGQYTYRYLVSDTNCTVDSAKYIITIFNCIPGGLSESVIESQALIQTNPVSDYLVLNEKDYDQLEIRELSGKLVLHIPGLNNQKIDVSQLKNGHYILVADKNGSKQFQRFMKQ